MLGPKWLPGLVWKPQCHYTYLSLSLLPLTPRAQAVPCRGLDATMTVYPVRQVRSREFSGLWPQKDVFLSYLCAVGRWCLFACVVESRKKYRAAWKSKHLCPSPVTPFQFTYSLSIFISYENSLFVGRGLMSLAYIAPHFCTTFRRNWRLCLNRSMDSIKVAQTSLFTLGADLVVGFRARVWLCGLTGRRVLHWAVLPARYMPFFILFTPNRPLPSSFCKKRINRIEMNYLSMHM